MLMGENLIQHADAVGPFRVAFRGFMQQAGWVGE
jgi:hypothetical protein